ncbi:MAG: ATP phosphoribosyltransferase [Flavobacteriales bacterium]|nr:ATP phosphoribosyltransferase [Flavobacteriales bacterium]
MAGTETRLRIAIQKSGRLNEDSVQVLKDCGIVIDNGKDQLKASARNFPLEVLYLRNDDIPQYLEDGVADIAIVGENLLVEKQRNVQVIQRLGFSKCRLSLAVPKDAAVNGLNYFNGKRIATSYPATLRKFLADNGIGADIHEISGSVEIAPNIGLADAICDLVSSGSTLFKNGLEEAHVILKSEAVLAAGPNLSVEAKEILQKLTFRLTAVLRARRSKYILMNVPNDRIDIVSRILPVLKSPTVMPLAEEGWSSLHSVIDEDKFWDVIDELKANGAEGILVVPIEKMVV